MDCKHFDEYISLYIDDVLSERQKKEFEGHLKQCPQCKKKLEETQKLVSLIKEIDEEPLPQGFRDNLFKKLEGSRKMQTRNLLRWIGAMAGVIIIFLSARALKDIKFTDGIDREVMPAEEIAEDMASISQDSDDDFIPHNEEGASAEVTSLENNQEDIRESITKIKSDLVEIYVQDICITPETLKLMVINNGLELLRSDENSVVIEITGEEDRNILYKELSKMGEIRDIGENIGSTEVKIIIKNKSE